MAAGQHNKDRWSHRLTTGHCASFTAKDLAFPGRLPKHDDGIRWLKVRTIEATDVHTTEGFASVWRMLRRRQAPPRVRIVPIPQHFGGVRWMLLCDRCGRKAQKLYAHARFGSRRLVCRTCGNLGYRSRRQTERDRLESSAARWRWKIAGDHRPKGMHRATYERIQAKQYAYEDQADAVLLAGLGRFVEYVQQRNADADRRFRTGFRKERRN